jgi:hypothetical protein
MKQASRFMPKYKPDSGKINKFYLFIFACISVAVIYFSPIILVVILGLFILSFIWGYFEQPKIDAYFARLREERKNLSLCEFAREFDTHLVDTWIIRATYEEIQNCMCLDEPIPLKASDDIFETLKLDSDDLDLDLIEILSQRTGRTLDDYEKNPLYGKVTNIRNLVLFLNYQPVANAI